MWIMSDEKCSSRAIQTLERIQDFALVFAIQAGCRLIENENWRAANRSPSDCQSLSLPMRECDTALAEHRIVTIRKIENKIMRVGESRGILDFFEARPLRAASNV